MPFAHFGYPTWNIWGSYMTGAIEFLLIITALCLTLVFCKMIYKRCALIRMFKRLEGIEGIEVKRLKCPFTSLIRMSRSPEYIVNIYENSYLVRCYNGGGVGKSVHFASPRFTARYSKMRGYYYRAGMGRVVKTRGFTFGSSVKIIEPIALSNGNFTKNYTEVLIFNPAPEDVTFVVKEKTSIRAAFTGDTVYGRRIFTASAFEIFADREARRIRLSENNYNIGEFHEKVN